MSFIYYKFKPLLEFKLLFIENPYISVKDLKTVIYKKEKIRKDAFDLVLYNSTTKREYEDEEELIHKNSSIDFKRNPKYFARLPKIKESSLEEAKKQDNRKREYEHISCEKFESMTEEERLKHAKNQSYQTYNPSFFKKIPPKGYTCHNCYSPGHWKRDCTLRKYLM